MKPKYIITTHYNYLKTNYCINNSQKVEAISKVTIIPRRRLKKQWSFYSALINIFLSLLLLFVNDNFLLSTQGLENAFLFKLIYYIFKVLFSTITLMSIVRTFTLINPEVKLYSIGRAILRSLVKTKQITSKNVKVVSKIHSFTTSYIYLKNATTHEQNLFSNSIKQFFGPVSQPRYLLCKPKNFIVKEYYVVPDAFKKNKELVTRLSNELIYCLGKTSIIFAKNDVGKNEVIKASKLYQFKFKNLDITSKNILLKNKRRKKK